MIYVSRIENGETINEGLCLRCAKEMGLAPVDDMMKKMGISDEDLDSISNEISELMEDEDFSPGGAPSLNLLNNLLGRGPAGDQDPAEPAEPETGTREKGGSKKDRKEQKQSKHKYLDSYCINLTQQARDGKLDRVIGREEEIYRVVQILNRRTKNNPCLIGEPGVGKTAIAEGLASRIAAGNAPAKLLDKEVYLLDLTALVAGTQFRGQFESRIKGLIEEVKKVGNVILVIDEVHNLVGTGDAEGSMNAANMLKPALSRGEIQVIGATTLNEYRKYIEKDAALERRFQTVMVNEPSVEDTFTILKGVKKHYEQYHGLNIPDEILRKAVALSERYLPDKAIDLMDEACSNASLKNKASNDLYLLGKKMAALDEQLQALEQQTAKGDDEQAYKRIAELKTDRIRYQAQQDTLKKEAAAEVTVEDLARVIELWTGISTGKILRSETDKLKDLETVLRKKIKGQDEAIHAIATAVRRSRAALTPRKRAVSFIFTGPTGVGKTELVKVLAGELFDTPETLIRLDMSEFMEKHSVSRIIGSPPGYIGYDEAGQLTEKIRRKPYSVVLFDEIEKAHPDVMNILLQILDEGRITDAHGRTVSFEHTIIIMTSNAGSNITGTAAGFNKSAELLSREKALKALSEFLRPEFLNRVDDIIVFKPLGKEVFPDIARIFLAELQEGLQEQGIALRWDAAAEQCIADVSYSAKYGARNVRRTVQREVEDALVNLLFEQGRFTEASVTAVDGKISVSAK